MRGGGKGALIQEDKSATLATNNDQYLFQPIPIHDKATRYKGGGETRNGDGAGNGLGIGKRGDPSYTITTGDHHAVATYQKVTGPLMANSHPGSYTGQDAFSDMLVAGEESDPEMEKETQKYIVRRLTPTECARLQGFPDRWGDIDPKEDFTDEEYRFWLDVRNTHATVIGGKEAKDYTKQQMLTWYNKLHTDSAEYKMWGNGIALPPALYCMQGSVDALNAETGNTPDPMADVQPVAEKKKKIASVKRKH